MSAFPKGWVTANLAEVCKLITDGTHHSPKNGPSGAYKYVTAKNIRPWGLDLSTITYVDAETHAQIFRRCPPAKGDVLYIKDGATTGIAIVNPLDEPFSMLSSVALLKPLTDVTSGEFLCKFLNSPDAFRQLTGDMTGSAIRRLTLTTINRQPIHLPPLPEQRRIAAKIDSLTGKSERARDHLDHIPRLVEKYKQAVLAAAFRGDLTREWRQKKHRDLVAVVPRNTESIAKKYLAKGVFAAPYVVPQTWQWLRLPDVGQLDRGRSRHRPRDDERLFGGAYPFIQTGEVRQANRFLASYSQTYSSFGLAQSRLWPIGTVCITIAANIAETAILAIAACFPDSVVGFLADDDKADASYVEFFMRTARENLEAFAPATAQKNINLDTLAAMRAPIPSVAEQQEIVRQIELAFRWIDRIVSEATSARRLIDRLDQAMLAKAFRGELVPQDPNDEPASALLERIKAERGATRETMRKRKVVAK
ncbi:type-1 restriction enzyme EcoKI specificity protein [Variibacter gotjawalensis]|uniref:Type-1 restriction enzyme EcoKI specificity protein n=1 Tax=Variibacter gotjawalensis TaxID=1333996 RepID=A0A0S3PNV6_9BRAD|nr:restriction endonuclease subunit S [Variibacter gotjawalensis]NIK47836.1 type I restriction enzyme S subunit [Variibacter gotjawalensis]RZS49723.1 type I restriction enzyme S subunit [Variibacter gotjawalensis]BAT57552.1 type-1 restriction enzyme EcoKI specificity protein [Variibacter gotjawalensis]